jgi:hypothetical protein
LRVAALTAAVATLTLISSPAFGVTRDDGDDPGPTLSAGEAIAIYAGIPLLLFLVIALLVYAASFTRGPRYRPGLGWWAAPVWFGGPADVESALANPQPTAGGGGASAGW